MLTVSLPPAHQEKLLRQIIEHSAVGAIRYNTGIHSAYSPHETVRRVVAMAYPLAKPVYIDLKGRQLRVVEWANLPEGPIVLNHNINVVLPAAVYFRGEDDCQLREVVDGNKIFVDPLPKAAVGRGQAVNIVASSLSVEGGLLPMDYEYIEAALFHGITRFMLSFVESWEDVVELEEAIQRIGKGALPLAEYEILLKIESGAGVAFVEKMSRKDFKKRARYRLMAARDDLMIQIGACAMPAALKKIIHKDPRAICASRLLLGLEQGKVSLADVSDVAYMELLGYKHFMFSDGISREHFPEAIAFWQEYARST